MSVIIRLGNASVQDVNVECLASDIVNKFVCLRDNASGGILKVQTADNRYRNHMPAIGILISKNSSTTGSVRISGVVEGLSGLTVNQKVFVGINGNLVSVMPIVATGNIVLVQQMGVAVSDSQLLLSGEMANVYLRRG